MHQSCRLAEQHFNIQLTEEPPMTHKHRFEAQLIQKEGLYFMRAEMIPPSPCCTLTAKNTEVGQVGLLAPMTTSDTGTLAPMLGPMTLTPTSVAAQAGGRNADYWCWSNQGHLMNTLHTVGRARRAQQQTREHPKDGSTESNRH